MILVRERECEDAMVGTEADVACFAGREGGGGPFGVGEEGGEGCRGRGWGVTIGMRQRGGVIVGQRGGGVGGREGGEKRRVV